jgi:hypothetical protein
LLIAGKKTKESWESSGRHDGSVQPILNISEINPQKNSGVAAVDIG